jgi:hypothetical protein
MSEIRHVARLQRPLAPMIVHHLSTSRPIEPPRDARAWQGTMDWLRLRTMVDALLRRAAGSKGAATATAATSTTPQTQEAIHG